MTNNVLVSIIIVSLNRKKELLKCIKSISEQSYKDFEILLIDNNSNDGSCEIIKSTFPDTKIYKTKKNLGTSYTRNAAINFSSGNLIWFLDSDVYLLNKNVLKNLVKKFNSDPKIDAMGGEAMLDDKYNIVGTKKLELYANGMIKGFMVNNIKNTNVKVLATCNLIVKSSIIKEIGGFDHFYFFYLEDLDLTYRIFKKGYKLHLINECPVIHYFSNTTRFKNYFLANRNRIYFLVKNFSLLNVIFLPILDLIYIFNLETLKRILNKTNNNSNIKYQISSSNKKFSLINFLLISKNAFLIFVSMLFSYIYIPYYLAIIFLKMHKKNFLEMINNEDFILISSNKDS
mgnify:FL=1|jgi:GT2 family glycosyltransferase